MILSKKKKKKKNELEYAVKKFRVQRQLVENLESPEFYTENYMEKIGIDMNHFILYLDDLIIRQKTFIKSNYDLFKKIKEAKQKKQQESDDIATSSININVQEVPLEDFQVISDDNSDL